MTKRKALGKGLSALIPEAGEFEEEGGSYFQCPIESIEPNPLQPRQVFDNDSMKELVESVKEKGIITPVIVTREGKSYRLIAGERRWRAAQKAGLTRIPVVVRETTPIDSLELTIIENIHRKDLNPIEEASAYKRWLEISNATQEILAKRVGKERSTVTNLLRLLTLPKPIQQDIVDGSLSMGHARVLAGMKDSSDQIRVRDLILKKGLSVRQAEALIKKRPARSSKENRSEEKYYLQSLADNLKRVFGTKVSIKKNGKKGSINIYFYSDEELARLIDVLT
jgi:ParB family transcriptional regulator, chromosome partitioning protein